MNKKPDIYICPKIQKRLEDLKDVCHDWIAKWNGVSQFEVTGPTGNRYSVDLEKQTCSCNRWQLNGNPCVHAVASIHTMEDEEKPPEWYVHKCYIRETFMQIYSHGMMQLNGKDMWTKPNLPTIIPPLVVTPKAGRPPTLRKRGIDEGPKPKATKMKRNGTIMKCSICRQEGHNKITCKTGRKTYQHKKKKPNMEPGLVDEEPQLEADGDMWATIANMDNLWKIGSQTSIWNWNGELTQASQVGSSSQAANLRNAQETNQNGENQPNQHEANQTNTGEVAIDQAESRDIYSCQVEVDVGSSQQVQTGGNGEIGSFAQGGEGSSEQAKAPTRKRHVRQHQIPVRGVCDDEDAHIDEPAQDATEEEPVHLNATHGGTIVSTYGTCSDELLHSAPTMLHAGFMKLFVAPRKISNGLFMNTQGKMFVTQGGIKAAMDELKKKKKTDAAVLKACAPILMPKCGLFMACEPLSSLI